MSKRSRSKARTTKAKQEAKGEETNPSKPAKLGSPPKEFNKAERERWRAYRASNPHLRREHRELLRGAVQTVIKYEQWMERLEKLLRKGSSTSKITPVQKQVLLLSSLMKNFHYQIIRVTSPARSPNPRSRNSVVLRDQDDSDAGLSIEEIKDSPVGYLFDATKR